MNKTAYITAESKDDWKIQPEDIGHMVAVWLRMNPRTLASKVEVRPSVPPSVQTELVYLIYWFKLS